MSPCTSGKWRRVAAVLLLLAAFSLESGATSSRRRSLLDHAGQTSARQADKSPSSYSYETAYLTQRVRETNSHWWGRGLYATMCYCP